MSSPPPMNSRICSKRGQVPPSSGCTQVSARKTFWQEIEEQSSFRLRRQRDHLALLLFRRFLVDELEIRRLAAQTSAVVNDLAVNLAGRKIDETQDFPRNRCERPHGRKRFR